MPEGRPDGATSGGGARG